MVAPYPCDNFATDHDFLWQYRCGQFGQATSFAWLVGDFYQTKPSINSLPVWPYCPNCTGFNAPNDVSLTFHIPKSDKWTRLKLSKTILTITPKNLFVRHGRLVCHLRINQVKIRSTDTFSWPCGQSLGVTSNDLCVMGRHVCTCGHVTWRSCSSVTHGTNSHDMEQ